MQHIFKTEPILYTIFRLLGFRAEAEVETNDGQIDAVVELPERIFLFEFKLDSTAEAAMSQIKNMAYYQKYRLTGKPMTLIGANFNTKKRTVEDWIQEEDSGMQEGLGCKQ